MSAPTDATRVDPMTEDQVLALPMVFPIWPTASAALGGSPAGLSRPTTYELAKSGRYPVPVIKQGRRLVARRSDVLAYIGLNSNEAPAGTGTSLAEHAPITPGSHQ